MEEEYLVYITLAPPISTSLPYNYTERNAYNDDGAPNTVGIYYEGIKYGEEIQYVGKTSDIIIIDTKPMILYSDDQYDKSKKYGYIDGHLMIEGKPIKGFVDIFRTKGHVWIEQCQTDDDGYFKFDNVPMYDIYEDMEYYLVAFNQNEFKFNPVSYDRLKPKPRIYDINN